MDFQSSTRFLPTQDEKDAMKGTSGRPGRDNPFITDEDPRLTKQYVYVAASSLIPDEPPNNPDEPAPDYTSTQKQMRIFLDFTPGGTQGAQASILMHPDYDGGPLAATFYGEPAEDQGESGKTVQWGISAAGFADSDSVDIAFGSESTVQDTYYAPETEHISAKSGDIAPGGNPTAGGLMHLRITCPAGTLSGKARLKGVLVEYDLA
jgi:hypothetical protein